MRLKPHQQRTDQQTPTAKASTGRGDVSFFRPDTSSPPLKENTAELFGTTVANANIHIRNILKEGELQVDSVIKESLITTADGKRYRTKLYRL